MKTISIRDLRQRWPDAEAALRVENEILITRDSTPVAKLVYVPPATVQRKRWNPATHARWQKRVSRGIKIDSDSMLAESRKDRDFPAKAK